MPRHEYTKAHILHRLRDQLVAAGIPVEHVEGDGRTVRVVVPDGVTKEAVDAVLAAHDAAALTAATQAAADQAAADRAALAAFVGKAAPTTAETVAAVKALARRAAGRP